MRIIPAIDIIDGKCVRLLQGDYAQKTVYNENPLDVAKSFEDAGLTHLHLIDLDGAKAGKVISWEVVERIVSNTNLHVDFGGGIKTQAEIERLLAIGVTQVNIGSMAVTEPLKILDWLKAFGAEKIILSADVKNESISISGWQEDASISIMSFIKEYIQKGITHVTCTDIGTDGMMTGPNVELYKKLLLSFPTLHLIASGGVSSVDDLHELKQIGVDGVIVGKAIYEGRISLDELINL
ncbi:MAG: 1-(5-phosphoribosyl)-5-[(5-phosphoribosylamino)methylideneamino]imidazole-4-carboxamide isomerase [Cyclobacteriaceae bacterium]|nr:1-(5-phosphoribosyl)-5-[(5-phosphoribosylamino)methylideneamino]imidazole-4-carboxamide isomerase [Cyclobacteriaceae bacterium]MDH4296075.1 1-(5-phosphoribosyl)-5-[(5-phosphoribosylamino)methylideneamino]imidazole-4-carboxamide isomerase [Cyclobacteriaceae bacterium]MDH5247720.1 1-(5-phosphoribosyl)-5-[(5-phosphoribosylamino)methylideneamino]imidazole-4-carboxamide isomerase [Cyclobacteriaceae bacterium]